MPFTQNRCNLLGRHAQVRWPEATFGMNRVVPVGRTAMVS
jgi:hypothetical protein